MSSNYAIVEEASDEQAQKKIENRRAERCEECDGRLIRELTESVCEQCGLVIEEDAIAREVTPSVHGPSGRNGSGPTEWATETTTSLRVDSGLHTTFFLGSDGRGKALSTEQKDKFGRLRMRHKRFQMESKRQIRLNEGLRDVEMIVGNLSLPKFVAVDAAELLKQASERRLPGGRMAWEALAAGAVVVALLQAGIDRSTEEVAVHAKTTHERTCAAARKLRCELGLVREVAPTYPWAVDAVVATLGERGLDVRACIELRRGASFLLELADEACIGPGTSRVTVAGSAVYAADRLGEGKVVTQAEVAAAAAETVQTSKGAVATYAREIVQAYGERYGQEELAKAMQDRLA
jgi:transcription initiation factor TFIIB